MRLLCINFHIKIEFSCLSKPETYFQFSDWKTPNVTGFEGYPDGLNFSNYYNSPAGETLTADGRASIMMICKLIGRLSLRLLKVVVQCEKS